MGMVLQLVSMVSGIAALICCIMVIVKMFQNNQTGLGIGTIIGLFCFIGYIIALIFGWKNKDAWGLQKVMPIFTVCFLVSLVCTGISIPMIIADTQSKIQQMQDQFNAEMEKAKQEQGANFGTLPAEPAPQP